MHSLEFWLTVTGIIAVMTESWFSVREQLGLYHFKDSFNNVTIGILNYCLDLGVKGFVFFVLTWFNKFALFKISYSFSSWFAVIVLQDFAYYWLHRVDHHCRFFWAVHVNHHSSTHFNLTTAIRSSLLQPLYRFVYYIPLALIGFSAIQIIIAFTFCNMWGFFIHTETVGKLGWLDKIFATPSNHRVHHGSNPKYLDKNLGMFLIIWDRMFGTYQKEEEPAVYGLTTNIESDNLNTIIFHEWKNIWKDISKPVSFKHKLQYLFGQPGWSHDGSRKTSRQLREEYFKSNVIPNKYNHAHANEQTHNKMTIKEDEFAC